MKCPSLAAILMHEEPNDSFGAAHLRCMDRRGA